MFQFCGDYLLTLRNKTYLYLVESQLNTIK